MLKYKVYLIIVSIGTVAASFSWLLDPFSESASTFDRVAYPLMTVFCATLTAALWWKKEQALQFVGLVGIAGRRRVLARQGVLRFSRRIRPVRGVG